MTYKHQQGCKTKHNATGNLGLEADNYIVN